MLTQSSLLKFIGDQSRLSLLSALSSEHLTVSDLISRTSLSQSLISHHLKDLKDGGLVKGEREGRWIYYSLTEKGQKVVSEKFLDSLPLVKLVGNKSRLKVLSVLKSGSCFVSGLANSTGLSQSLISHHLKDLKDGGLVKGEREGRWVSYSLVFKGNQLLKVLGRNI